MRQPNKKGGVKREIASLADLTPDPNNARRHTPRNVGLIEDALKEVGAARSIVIDEDGVVLAGNATIEAAANAFGGDVPVRVVEATGNEIIAVRRTGLSKKQKTRLALYDNRAAEFAEWDAPVLAELDADELAGLFETDEIEKMLGVPSDEIPEPPSSSYSEQHGVIVICDGEVMQERVFNELQAQGYNVRVVTT